MSKGKTKPTREGLHASPTHLLHRALQLALDFHADAAGPSALTQRQFTVLAAASHAEGLTQNDLVRATGIDRSTLADLVARLLAKGLLLRERSATDGRANTVRLSDAGRDALAEGGGAAATADQRLLALLSSKKRDGFMKTLASLAAAADAPPAPKEPKAPKVAKADKADRTKKKRKKGAKKAKPAAAMSEAVA
ncbi:MAG TPA: MarR family transcriptional regulator [Caulobacteraceae bacterium]|nr:MarR family transcriptional regulator [Caulobacteraceae bacterium]